MTGQAIPHTEYSQHLQRCLSSRFCHASGLTLEQGQQPDLLQQGIALLVSALESGPRAAATAQQKRKTADHAPRAGSAKADCAAAGEEGMCNADPSRQHASTARIHTSINVASEFSKSFQVSMSHPGICSTPDMAEDAAFADDAQQGHLEGGPQGNSSDVSMSLSGSLQLTGAAEEQPEKCRLPFNCFGRNSLGKGTGSAPSPSISEECEGSDMKDSLHSPARRFLDLPLADDIKMPSMGLFGHFEGSAITKSPQLADIFQQQTASIHSPVEASISLHELNSLEGDCEQDLTRDFDKDLAFLEEGSIVSGEEPFAIGQSDMQTLRCTRQFNQQDIALGRIDEELPNCNGLDSADAEQAFGKDPLQVLRDADELDTDLHDNSKRMRDTQGWYNLPSSTAMVTCIADPDPVAAFSGFCESLAV